MASKVIVIDSSPEPERAGPRSEATSILDDDPPDPEMESQIQSSSSYKNKGKQKAPAPVVYDISSDDSEPGPAYGEDEGEVQFTGMSVRGTMTVAESSEESKKRKRASESEPPDSHTGPVLATTAASVQGSSSSSAFAGPSSTSNPTFTSTSEPAFTFASGANANTNAAAGPSGHTSLSSFSFHGPAVKKARFDADPVVPTASTNPTVAPLTAPPTLATAAAASTAVQHALPTYLVAPPNRAAVERPLDRSQNAPPVPTAAPANAPPRAPPRVRGSLYPQHPPGPFYEGALLPPGHFYHDAVRPLPPPPPVPAPAPHANADNADNVPNDVDNFIENYLREGNRMVAQREAQFYNHHPDPNPNPAVDANANENPDPALALRLAADMAALRARTGFPGAFGVQRGRDEAREHEREQDLQRQVDAEMARVHARMRERMREGEVQRDRLQRERERAVEREREWQRELERQQERDRELEETLVRIREGSREARARHARVLVDLGVEAGARGGGAGAGGNLFGPQFRRVGVNDEGRLPLFDNNREYVINLGPLDANDLAIVNNAFGGALNALNGDGAHGLADANNPNGDVNINIQNPLAGIQDELGDLDNELDRVEGGIDDLHDDIDAALGDFVANAARNVERDNHNHNHNGIFGNPLFALPVAAAPAPAVNEPAQDADADVLDMDRELDGAPFTDLSDGEDEDDIYVPNREQIRPPADPPVNGATAVATGAANGPPPPVAAVGPVSTAPAGAGAQSRPVAAPSSASASATVIDVDALQHIPVPRAAAGAPVAGPSNGTAASGSSSSVPARPVDPIDAILASILEVVPDALPEHAATLARTHFPSFGVMHTAEHVLGLLFESKDYPRRGKGKVKGKKKGKEEKESLQGDKKEADGETDFLNTKMKGKPGRSYRRLALYHLRHSFPHARAAQLATASSMRYARGHAYLTERIGPAPHPGNVHNADTGINNDPRAHRHRRRLEDIRAQYYGVPGRAGPSRANNAGVGVGVVAPVNDGRYNTEPARVTAAQMAEEEAALRDVVDKEFAKERRWVERRYGLPKSNMGTGVPVANADGIGETANEPHTDDGKAKDNGKSKGKAKEISLADAVDEPVEDGMGVECQCCFTEYAFSRMAQCPEAHLFCISCISQYAAVQLGNMNPSLACMHADGCALPFGELELRRVLPWKLMRLYERVLSQKAVEGLEGLEACPFCEWKCVMDISPEVDRLFRCGNVRGDADDDDEDEDECGVVSCRLCKKLDHTPKSCQEAEEDKHLDGQHAVEEAMTAALMRNCPKCKKAFIKEGGCNKMTCPYCGTHSCYTCRKQITGYDHFDLRPLDPGEPVAAGKCRTHDTRQLEEIHANEVKAAAEKALAEYKAAHPDAEDGQIKVDIPEAPAAPAHNRMNAFGFLGPRQRAAAMAAGYDIPGNAPWGQAGGPRWGAAHNPANPRLPPGARDHLALLAAHGVAPPQMLHNAAGNMQYAAGPAPPAPPAPARPQPRGLFLPPLRQRRIDLVPLQQRHDNNMGRIGGAQPQAHDHLPPQDIVMADAPPLGDHRQLLGQERIQQMMDRMAAHQRVAVAPQLQAPVPPVPQPHHYPNFLFHRPGALGAPQPPQPQPQPPAAPRQPVGMDHHNIMVHQRLLQMQQQRQQLLQWHQQQQQQPQQQYAAFAPPPAANPGLGALHHENNRIQPFRPAQVPARLENDFAGPAYPDVRIFGDRPVVQPPPLQTVPQPIPAPTFNIPGAARLRQEGVGGMGAEFGASMDIDMQFGAGVGAGMNMGMHGGAGGGMNEHRPANPLQDQAEVDADADAARLGTRDARGQYMRPY